MNASEYKKYHESYMQNNHGSNAVHTFFAIFFTVLCTLICCLGDKHHNLQRYIYEYSVIVLPLIFGHTLIANYPYHFNALFIVLTGIVFLKYRHNVELFKVLYERNIYKNKKFTSVSCMRGLTYLITGFAILAVDFRVFPRFLAKTEKYGYSLMDTGVGLFVLMSGLVYKERKRNVSAIFKDNTKLVITLLLLGIIRFISVKKLDYQEHVTEYGVHWNFFYTLALSKTLSTILLFLIDSEYILVLSILVGIFHEFLLATSLQQWVFSDLPRNSLLNANREGISSCLGYVSLYIFAVYLKKKLTDKSYLRINLILRLLSMSVSFWLTAYFLNLFKPASRTLCNLSYCLFLEAVLLTIVTLLHIFEILFQNNKNGITFSVPLILSAVNNNGLLYFLIANITTGLINLNVRTLFVNNVFAIFILNIYMIFTICFAIFLQKRGIRM